MSSSESKIQKSSSVWLYGAVFIGLSGISIALYSQYSKDIRQYLAELFNIREQSQVRDSDLVGTSVSRAAKLGGIHRKSLTKRTDRIVEICVSDLVSVRNACKGGCNSIELCANRKEGGNAACIYYERYGDNT